MSTEISQAQGEEESEPSDKEIDLPDVEIEGEPSDSDFTHAGDSDEESHLSSHEGSHENLHGVLTAPHEVTTEYSRKGTYDDALDNSQEGFQENGIRSTLADFKRSRYVNNASPKRNYSYQSSMSAPEQHSQKSLDICEESTIQAKAIEPTVEESAELSKLLKVSKRSGFVRGFAQILVPLEAIRPELYWRFETDSRSTRFHQRQLHFFPDEVGSDMTAENFDIYYLTATPAGETGFWSDPIEENRTLLQQRDVHDMLRAQINCRGLFVKYVLAEQDRMDTAAIDRLNYPNLTIVHEAAVPFAMRVQNSTMPLLSYLHQGAPKRWTIIRPAHKAEVQRFLNKWEAERSPDAESGIYLPLDTIKAIGWGMDEFTQYQNELLVIWPSASY
ncbi:MAG: hypothetical protein MMC33_002678 [Icmadophila ericetorum]|nr:hypothetical protein [Icmadophila ericetorum]